MAVRWEVHIPQAMQRHTGSVKAPAVKPGASQGCNEQDLHENTIRPGDTLNPHPEVRPRL